MGRVNSMREDYILNLLESLKLYVWGGVVRFVETPFSDHFRPKTNRNKNAKLSISARI